MRYWTAEEITYLREHYATDGPRAVAAALDRPVRGVAFKACKLEVSKKHGCKPRPTEEDYIATARAVGKRLSIPPHQILGHYRGRMVAYARWDVWAHFYAKNHSTLGIAAVSGFDHSTISLGLRRRQERLDRFRAAA